MKLLSLSLLFFTTTQSLAQNIPDVVEKVSNPSSLSPSVACTPENYQSCVQDLCGPATLRKFSQFTGTTPHALTPDERNEFKKVFDDEVKRRLQLLSQLKEAFKKGELVPDTSKWQDFEWEKQAFNFFRPLVKVEVDMTLPFEKRLSWKGQDDIAPDIRPSFDEWLKNFSQQKFDYGMLFENRAITVDEARKIVSEKSTEIQKQDSFKNMLEFDKTLSDRLTKINELDLDNLANLYFQMNSASMMMSLPPFCKSESCRKGVLAFFQTNVIQKKLSDIEAEAQKPQEIYQDAIEGCESRNEVTDEYKQVVSHFDKEVRPKLIEASTGKAVGKICPEAAQGFSDFLKSATFDYGLQGKENFLDGLKKFKESFPTKTDFETYQRFADNGLFDDFDQFCSYASFTGDQWNGANTTLTISPLTCLHPQGNGVFMHELGHAFAMYISKMPPDSSCRKRYLELRDCVTSRTKNIPPFKSVFKWAEKDSQFSEEDMADYFENLISKDTGESPTCTMLPVSPDEKEYINIDPGAYSEPMMMGAGAHSPPLIRMLREKIDRGLPLSASCEAVTSALTNYNWSKCE